MKFAVFGAGGVGCFYGALLSRKFEVTFIGRGKHLEAMKRKGLKLISEKFGEINVKESDRVSFTSNASEARDADVVLLCVKSYDTQEAALKLKTVLKEDSVVISVQNGIENEEILAKYLGKERVLGATAFVGSFVKEPGVVIHQAAGTLEIGELSAKTSDRVEKIAEAMRSCGIDVRVSKNILYTLWKKLMWNVAFNPYSVITRSTVGQLLENPHTRKTLKRLMRECQKTARVYGVDIPDRVIESYLKSLPSLKDYKTSMLLDFERGKRLEIDGITGALLRKAEEKGLELPANECILGAVELLTGRD